VTDGQRPRPFEDGGCGCLAGGDHQGIRGAARAAVVRGILEKDGATWTPRSKREGGRVAFREGRTTAIPTQIRTRRYTDTGNLKGYTLRSVADARSYTLTGGQHLLAEQDSRVASIALRLPFHGFIL
jgi:hypothetical protein